MLAAIAACRWSKEEEEEEQEEESEPYKSCTQCWDTIIITKQKICDKGVLDGVKMYAFYSLLVYIFYTVFKKEEEEAVEEEPGPVSMETASRKRDGHTPKMGKKACARLSESSSSSDSDEMSLSDEEDKDGLDIPACTPLASFCPSNKRLRRDGLLKFSWKQES
ncbi:hypothetical protein Q5P01_011152 [Channa striata]|uniref:Uncharacterized protein n=1 Tax=Channa striata TaxID=64152 RepID=A0AA88MVW1_CHASR|nr:hypothetical protein Q5P01_011152 [Channa striata]